jgi:hypothetical protein
MHALLHTFGGAAAIQVNCLVVGRGEPGVPGRYDRRAVWPALDYRERTIGPAASGSLPDASGARA